MRIKDALAPENKLQSVVKPEYMSHGTLECYDLKATRRFFEEFLGLECVRHAKPAMAVRCGMRFHIVCLEVGETLRPVSVSNHWGLDVGSAAEVDRIHKAAHALKDKYRIGKITDLVKQHGVYSFYLEDLDHNWWEIQYYDGVQHDDMFDFGDRFGESDLHQEEMGETK
jgi:catechol 2,3-dioxygenase-like lactoylglutathione lyase family enzyme